MKIITLHRDVETEITGRIILNNGNVILKIMNIKESNKEKTELGYIQYKALERFLQTSKRPRDIICSEVGITTSSIIKYTPNQKIFKDLLTKTRKIKDIEISFDNIPETINKLLVMNRFYSLFWQVNLSRVLIF
ncbi:hypothetical protein DMUE_4727 [Dictyocoela muelleri]|nr:hypothetical protein DMUE_4727 [Dictyocoela muelleri]